MATADEIDRDQFRQSLRDQNFAVHIIHPDNNSLFSAIAKERLGGDDEHEEARYDIHDFIQANRHMEKFKWYFRGKTPEQANQEIEAILKDECFGGHLALMGACYFYKRQIIVHLPTESSIEYPDTPSFDLDIHLAYHPPTEHYDLLTSPDILPTPV